MYTPLEILERCKLFANQYFKQEFNDTIRMSSRMTRTMGQVTAIPKLTNGVYSYTIKEVTFSTHYFNNDKYSNEELDKIIKHELCHWYIFKHRQESRGHDSFFKQMCLSIGGDLGYTHGTIENRDGKMLYAVVCKCCGRLVETRVNKPSTKLLTNYTSKCCHARLDTAGRYLLSQGKEEDEATAEQIQIDYLKNR